MSNEDKKVTVVNEVKTSIPSAEDLQEIKSSLSQATASITTLTQPIAV